MADSFRNMQQGPNFLKQKLKDIGDDFYAPVVALDDDTITQIGGGGGGGAVTVADGDDEALGAIADVAVSTDANGTVNAHLRGLVVLLVNFLSRFPASLGAKTAANSLPVTLASDDVILARIGEVQASPTANTLLDRLKALLTGIVLAAGTNVIGATKDAGPQWTSTFGVSGARFTSANASAAAANVTDDPTPGQKLVITDVLISVDAVMRVDLKEETSGTVLASLYMPANSTVQFTPRSRLKLATADRQLAVQTSVAGNIAITAFYYSEA